MDKKGIYGILKSGADRIKNSANIAQGCIESATEDAEARPAAKDIEFYPGIIAELALAVSCIRQTAAECLEGFAERIKSVELQVATDTTLKNKEARDKEIERMLMVDTAGYADAIKIQRELLDAVNYLTIELTYQENQFTVVKYRMREKEGDHLKGKE